MLSYSDAVAYYIDLSYKQDMQYNVKCRNVDYKGCV